LRLASRSLTNSQAELLLQVVGSQASFNAAAPMKAMAELGLKRLKRFLHDRLRFCGQPSGKKPLSFGLAGIQEERPMPWINSCAGPHFQLERWLPLQRAFLIRQSL